MFRNCLRYDVVLVGGGITGLMACDKLTRLGLRVLLLEREEMLANGPSTRNEGWLHCGTYHAGSIRDRSAAVQVARRCIYGHEQVRTFAPEAVEGADETAFALIGAEDRIEEIVSRWDEAGVRYRPRPLAAVAAAFPAARLDGAAAAFEVADVSINTRLLYRKLHASAVRNGADIRVGARLAGVDGRTASLAFSNGDACDVEADVFVYSAGYGAKDLLRLLFGMTLPIRYWKSHLVVTPRLGSAGLFYIDPHEAAMMHHGSHSIVGLNEDAVLCEEPGYDVVPEKAANLHRALGRLVPGWDALGFVDIACVKVDFAQPGASRSLNIAVHEPVPGHICVLPGKMTEAPFLTDHLVALLHGRIESGIIAPRPCDLFAAAAEREAVHAL